MQAHVETLIFLDVDGVLNIGVKDGPNDPVAFTSGNLQLALQMASSAKKKNMNPIAERILAVAERKVDYGENSTYEKLVANDDELSELLVSRFVKLVKTAGTSCHLVFSSSWRRPKHAKRKERLETCIAKHMGKPFTFEASTSLREERKPIDRLQTIGEYLVNYCQQRGKDAAPALRILVLDDFCSTPLGGQEFHGTGINSPEAAERYVAEFIGKDFDVKVKVVHTYDSWTTKQGTQIEIGCGLTMKHFSVSLHFLDDAMPLPVESSASDCLLAQYKTANGANDDFCCPQALFRFLACVRGSCTPSHEQHEQ
mmetsp:Transcript_113175/g.225361  ORF Transcript_113175/g.225361 Transcript_113175/m.225361 type:complete len:312 (-) Transcript_113175:32-967(-)